MRMRLHNVHQGIGVEERWEMGKDALPTMILKCQRVRGENVSSLLPPALA